MLEAGEKRRFFYLFVLAGVVFVVDDADYEVAGVAEAILGIVEGAEFG